MTHAQHLRIMAMFDRCQQRQAVMARIREATAADRMLAEGRRALARSRGLRDAATRDAAFELTGDADAFGS